MPQDLIASRLKAFREQSRSDQVALQEYCRESPFERTRREVRENLAKSEEYRASVLKNVTTFAGLSSEAIVAAAQSLDEVFYKKGDIVIQQDDIGDCFYVLEEGLVSVTRKANVRDMNEPARELTRLGKNAHFGEIALLTAEPRSATVTVISDEAKCLRMTKHQFEELLATTNKLQAESRRQIGRDVLDTVPLFKNMTTVNKKKLLECMIPMTYLPGSYICRQGTTGNTFFILTEGTCRVSINTSDHNEREVASLKVGDFFGEVALIEASNRRTANVISNNTVSCLTLSRSDFNRLLRNLKVKIMEHQAMRNANVQKNESSETKHMSSLSRKRRVSGYNTHGQRDEVRIANLFKRFSKFTAESLWNSLYSRFYRDLLLDNNRVLESGKFASLVLRGNGTRFESVQAITEQCVRILEMDCVRRTSAEHAFIVGLLKTRNQLREKLCKTWPAHQFVALCKKLKIMRAKPFRKIVEADTRGTTALLIVRGAVRIFGVVKRGEGMSKAYFEEDLGPGEIFGEAALSGMHTRMLTAMSLTPVDIITIDDSDYMAAQDRDTQLMGTEERSRFLGQIPLFKTWDSYKLIRLAHALVQLEIPKSTVLTSHNTVSKDMYFIVQGRVDVVDSLEKKNVITSLLGKDYCGESGLLNRFVKAVNKKVQEEFYTIAATRLEVLVMQETSSHLFDLGALDGLRASFEAKLMWRKERVGAMKWERAKVRKQYYIMHLEAALIENGIMKKSNEETAKTAEIALPPISPRHSVAPDSDSAPTPISPGQMSDFIEERISRPSSPVDLKPSLDALRPASPPRSEPEPPQLSPLDIAYKLALVHPLDERLRSEEIWYHPPAPGAPKMENMQEIPQVFARDLDMLMVTSACKDMRTLNKVHETVWMARRPASAKHNQQFKQDIIVRFPSMDQRADQRADSRPSSAKKIPSPRPSTPTDVENFVQKDDREDLPIDFVGGEVRILEREDEQKVQFFVKSLKPPSAKAPLANLAPLQSLAPPRPATAPLRSQSTSSPTALSQAISRINSQQRLQLTVDIPVPATARKASLAPPSLSTAPTQPDLILPSKTVSRWSSVSVDASNEVHTAGSYHQQRRDTWGLLVQPMNIAPHHAMTLPLGTEASNAVVSKRGNPALRGTYRIKTAQRLAAVNRGPLVNKSTRQLLQPLQ